MPGTHGVCIDRVQKGKEEIRSIIHLTQSEIHSVHKVQVKPEQQQWNLDSLAQVWSRE
jgi:hypothetical protein